MNIEICDLTDDAVEDMASKMRHMDLFEFDVMTGGKPVIDSLQLLKKRSSRSRAAYVDGRLVAVYGVVNQTVLSGTGSPWLAATDMIERPDVRRAFVRHTRKELAWLAEGFSTFWNLVSAENKLAIRWLKWTGFIFDGTGFDIRGHRFLKFHMGD